jgi:hypothetical protein
MKIGKIADLIKESYVSEESGGIVTAKVRKLKKSFHPAERLPFFFIYSPIKGIPMPCFFALLPGPGCHKSCPVPGMGALAGG